MKTREEALTILATLLPVLRRKYRIAGVELFGSYSPGEQIESSDIDLAVEFTGSITYREHVALEEELSSALGARVDIVDRDLLGFRIRQRIEREAIAV